MNVHEKYMYRCLQLANLGKYNVAPNPMVGAVIVHNDKIIGEGYHIKFGTPHAEPNAINSVKEKNKKFLSQSTLYVNLEPCSHYGKTPPCANLIVRSNIKKVVIATLDPNPKIAGNGVKILQEAGIEVVVGVLETEARELNKRFFTFQEKRRPYIILKWAQTADGFIDKNRNSHTEKPLLISNVISQKLVHKMRAENMAIMVGKNTVLLDNPTLTVRHWRGNSPIRITFDKNNEIPNNFNIKNGEMNTYIFGKENNLVKENLRTFRMDDFFNLKSILSKLYSENMHSILVEGGQKLLNSFIEQDLWDEINIEISSQQIRFGISAPNIPARNTIKIKNRTIDNNLWIQYVKGQKLPIINCQ